MLYIYYVVPRNAALFLDHAHSLLRNCTVHLISFETDIFYYMNVHYYAYIHVIESIHFKKKEPVKLVIIIIIIIFLRNFFEGEKSTKQCAATTNHQQTQIQLFQHLVSLSYFFLNIFVFSSFNNNSDNNNRIIELRGLIERG